MRKDLLFALRTLGRSPSFTIIAVLSVALGVGANIAVFSLFDQVLLRSLPVRAPDGLVIFEAGGPEAPGSGSTDNHQTIFSYPAYRDLRDGGGMLAGVAARASASVVISDGDQSEHGRAELVSGNFFEVLGIRTAIGRTLTPADDVTPGAHPVVVLSHGYWASRFASDPSILGRKISINGHPMVVAGVTQPGFRGILSGQTPELFLPIAMKRQATPTWDGLTDRSSRWLNVIARLRTDRKREQAEAAMQVVYSRMLAEEVRSGVRLRTAREGQAFLERKLELRPAAQGINFLSDEWQRPLFALMGAALLVLLIACANIGGLLLARGAGRQTEIAIRLALGAGRGAIVRQLLIESLILAGAGGLAGVALAGWTSTALVWMLPVEMTGGWVGGGVDGRLLAFGLGISVVTGLACGLVPALQASGSDLAQSLRTRAASLHSRTSARLRTALVAAQFALSLMLLVAAGLFSRTLFNLSTVDRGFTPERLMTFAVDPGLNGYDLTRGRAFFAEIERRLLTIPSVTAVGAAGPGPLTNATFTANATIEGYRPPEGLDARVSTSAVTPGFFRALGMGVLAGRDFSERDSGTAPKVVAVNEAFVRRYLAGQNPLGRKMTFGAGNRVTLDREIVGVIRDFRGANPREPQEPFVYYPCAQRDTLGRLTFYARTASEESRIAPAIRALVREMDANLPVFELKPMRLRVEESAHTDKLMAVLSTAFGALATLLAAVGLYGMIAYTVARRTAEIGIRMALGALPRDICWLVMRRVILIAAGGMALGLPAALGLGRLIESQLFGLKAADPVVFTGAALMLALIAALAGVAPSQRAARIQPVTALRNE